MISFQGSVLRECLLPPGNPSTDCCQLTALYPCGSEPARTADLSLIRRVL